MALFHARTITTQIRRQRMLYDAHVQPRPPPHCIGLRDAGQDVPKRVPNILGRCRGAQLLHLSRIEGGMGYLDRAHGIWDRIREYMYAALLMNVDVRWC